jgi:hypothetical protein
MVNIGSTDFYINVPSLPRGEFEEYSTQLFDDWENHVDSVLKLSDYSLSLNVEEGSVKAVAKIAATTLGVLYIGIGQYGSFISGLKTIESQVHSANNYFGQRAAVPFEYSRVKSRVIKRGESLTRLRNLFKKVQRREITVEEAMLASKGIFGSEIETVPGFMVDLKESFEQTPLSPQQMQLPLAGVEDEILLPDTEKPTKSRPTQPREPVPVPELYRVEVWRESKKGKRNVRVVNL